ncbi:hypothetical protein HNQ02_003299 [Flavobacterium sp. 7E]|uniref:hypothetical protein n=1 Tax=Flavobacterium sp. 7E TaxID=2735898 RepID=UPI00156EE9E2|nr:hypothetical protein [Flavobacterium sp. 7E]NRS90359.1 hypothetical protein [Flavobacterium sp. 7E]
MKLIKRTILIILILTTITILFRGCFYRHLITYKSIGSRTNYSLTNEKLVDYINANTNKKADSNIENSIKTALSITSKQLNFTAEKNDNDPNKLITSKKAHCVGYASFFATTCNYILIKNNLAQTWIAKPQVGQLYFLGSNMHQYFNSSFFKDHDFVTIENKTTAEIFAVDPTVNDYLCIDFINYSK